MSYGDPCQASHRASANASAKRALLIQRTPRTKRTTNFLEGATRTAFAAGQKRRAGKCRWEWSSPRACKPRGSPDGIGGRVRTTEAAFPLTPSDSRHADGATTKPCASPPDRCDVCRLARRTGFLGPREIHPAGSWAPIISSTGTATACRRICPERHLAPSGL